MTPCKRDPVTHPAIHTIRRCGELLKKIEPGKTGPKTELSTGSGTQLSRKQAAKDAGLSERQRKTAIRVANVPEEEFKAIRDPVTPPAQSHIVRRCRGGGPGGAEIPISIVRTQKVSPYSIRTDSKERHNLLKI